MNNQELEQELKERINAVEEGMSGLSRMTKKDYILVAVVVVICFVGIIVGAFL